MSPTRARGLAAALGASALAGAALTVGPAVASTPQTSVSAEVTASQSQATCVDRAMKMARPLIASVAKPGSAKARGADRVLERIRDRPQRGLTAAQRRRNVAGSIIHRRAIDGRVVLVDDVLTTGATVRAAAHHLRRAGADRIEVVTFARVATIT